MRVPVGISACLLGQSVRYDGDHKRTTYLADALAARIEWIPVCPEIGAGMGVPREQVHLVGPEPRMLGLDTATDWTDRLLAFSRAELDRLAALDVSGFVFKSRSPSCDLHDLHGLFARAFQRRFPALPVADERDLADPTARAAFVARVAATRATLRTP